MTVFLSMVLYNSCDENNITDTDHLSNSLKLDNDLYNSIKDEFATDFITSELAFSKSKRQFTTADLTTSNNNTSEIETLNISSSLVNLENLNTLFNIQSTSVVVATLFKDGVSGSVSGFAIYHVDSGNKMKLNVYSLENSVFKKIEMDAEKVDDFKYDHILYISKEFFPGKDIESLAINTVNDFSSEFQPDDFSILEVVSRLGHDNRYDNFNLQNISEGFKSGKPCGQVPLCRNGGNNTYCAPFASGCRVRGGVLTICPKITVSEKLNENNMNSEQDLFDSLLHNKTLYSLKDDLELYVIGGFLVESYYSVAKQFDETIDVELLLEILVNSPKLSELVDAFLQDDSNYVLTEDIFDELTGVINLSVSKSKDKVYKDFMINLVKNLEMFIGKNISQIKKSLILIE